MLNFDKEEKEIVLEQTVTDLDTEEKAGGTILLQPYGTRVYRIS